MPADHPLSSACERGLARLKALQPLRDRDPAAMLQALGPVPDRWPARPGPSEAALLEVQHRLLSASAEFWLLRYAEVDAMLAPLDRLLDLADTLAPAGRRQSQALRLRATNLRAFMAHRQSDYPGALRAYLDALALAQTMGDAKSSATLHCNLANSYEESGLFAESIEHHRQALAVAEAHGMAELVLDSHNNLGNALASAGDSLAGLRHAEQALSGFAARSLPSKQAMSCLGVAERLIELGRLDQAQQVLSQRPQVEPAGTRVLVDAYAAGQFARIALGLEQWQEARRCFESAQVLCHRAQDCAGQARALTGLARLDLDSGAPAMAQQQINQALAALNGTDAGRELNDAHACASAIAQARGDLAQALVHERQHQAGYARLFNQQSARQAQLLAVRHAVERAQTDADRARLEDARLTEALAEVAGRIRQIESGQAAAPGPHARPGPQALRGLGLTAREAEIAIGDMRPQAIAVSIDTGAHPLSPPRGARWLSCGGPGKAPLAACIQFSGKPYPHGPAQQRHQPVRPCGDRRRLGRLRAGIPLERGPDSAGGAARSRWR